MLGLIILAVNWFNPMIWLAYGLFCEDLEIACDESTISRFSHDEKREYSKSILKYVLMDRNDLKQFLTYGGGNIKERIGIIMREKRKRKISSILALVIAVSLCGCFMVERKGEVNSAEITKTMYAHISINNDSTLGVDDLEWIIPGSKRAEELNINDPNASWILYNENDEYVEYRINKNCLCKYIDSDNASEIKTCSLDDFISRFNDDGLSQKVFIVDLWKGDVVSITEKYLS